jgi:hypothetical protein
MGATPAIGDVIALAKASTAAGTDAALTRHGKRRLAGIARI